MWKQWLAVSELDPAYHQTLIDEQGVEAGRCTIAMARPGTRLRPRPNTQAHQHYAHPLLSQLRLN